MYLRFLLFLSVSISSTNFAMTFDSDGKPVVNQKEYTATKGSYIKDSALMAATLTALGAGLGGVIGAKANDTKAGLVCGTLIGVALNLIAIPLIISDVSDRNKVIDANKGKTIHGSVADNNMEGVKAYLNYSTDYANKADSNGYTSVQVALAHNSTEALHLLLAHGASLPVKGYIVSINKDNSFNVQWDKKPNDRESVSLKDAFVAGLVGTAGGQQATEQLQKEKQKQEDQAEIQELLARKQAKE